MKVIYNRFIPFGRYAAINLFGVLFVRQGVNVSPALINHEAIHTAQMKERLYVFFYLLYVLEFVALLLRYGKWNKAYRAISFEREAYANQYNLRYLESRNK